MRMLSDEQVLKNVLKPTFETFTALSGQERVIIEEFLVPTHLASLQYIDEMASGQLELAYDSGAPCLQLISLLTCVRRYLSEELLGGYSMSQDRLREIREEVGKDD